MMRLLRGLPVFWLTLVMLVVGVGISQMLVVAWLFVAPPPRPDFNRMSDMVRALSGVSAVAEDSSDSSDRERVLSIHPQAVPGPPPPPADMVSDPALTKQLADRLGRTPADVRLYFKPDRPVLFFHRGRRPFAIHNGEPLFFTPIVAAVNTGGQWRLARTPRPLIAPWQRRQLFYFAASLIVLVPLGWVFARAITRPIRRFAEAADRLGGDPHAPPVAEEGPAELRVTARALNRMQARVGAYLDERTAMIGAIAHDLRTPLARIAFRIEGAPEPLREKVLADVEQMRAMLAATIGFIRSTQTHGERSAVDLTALLRFAVEQECEVGHPVTLSAEAPAVVLGDALALERLLQNLIDNGIAYGGQVDVSIETAGEQAIVTVADHGPGMSSDLLERAFQPFVRGEPSRNRATGGIGLGLTIARAISEDHGGVLTLSNRRNGGLEARLALPLADQPARLASQRSSATIA
jgi:two-component system, OmpR family, sensor kinase